MATGCRWKANRSSRSLGDGAFRRGQAIYVFEQTVSLDSALVVTDLRAVWVAKASTKGLTPYRASPGHIGRDATLPLSPRPTPSVIPCVRRVRFDTRPINDLDGPILSDKPVSPSAVRRGWYLTGTSSSMSDLAQTSLNYGDYDLGHPTPSTFASSPLLQYRLDYSRFLALFPFVEPSFSSPFQFHQLPGRPISNFPPHYSRRRPPASNPPTSP